jgi:hypothetical protein
LRPSLEVFAFLGDVTEPFKLQPSGKLEVSHQTGRQSHECSTAPVHTRPESPMKSRRGRAGVVNRASSEPQSSAGREREGMSKPIAAPLGSATTGAVACSNLAIFVVTLICNGIAGNKNKAVSDAHPTGFTPAGYAFAIWGVIYALGTCCVLFLAAPTKWRWAVDHVGPFLAINLAANAMWIFAFTQEWAGLWLSVALIFCGLLVPLVVLHRRLSIGSDLRPVTVTEFVCVHLFISLYLGWTCVACIANVAVAATPTGGPAPELLGWSPSTWSIVMQTVAATLAIVLLALSRYVRSSATCTASCLAARARQSPPRRKFARHTTMFHTRACANCTGCSLQGFFVRRSDRLGAVRHCEAAGVRDLAGRRQCGTLRSCAGCHCGNGCSSHLGPTRRSLALREISLCYHDVAAAMHQATSRTAIARPRRHGQPRRQGGGRIGGLPDARHCCGPHSKHVSPTEGDFRAVEPVIEQTVQQQHPAAARKRTCSAYSASGFGCRFEAAPI